MNDSDFNSKIKQEFSLIKIFYLLLTIGVFLIVGYGAFKFTNAITYTIERTGEFPTFDFNTFISIILALFAVFLSVEFYRLTSIQSDKFYRQIFNYFKDQDKSLNEIIRLIQVAFVTSESIGKVTKLMESNPDLSDENKIIIDELNRNNEYLNTLVYKYFIGPSHKPFHWFSESGWNALSSDKKEKLSGDVKKFMRTDGSIDYIVDQDAWMKLEK
ncbi:hypothetical protein [Methanospirillum sp.]